MFGLKKKQQPVAQAPEESISPERIEKLRAHAKRYEEKCNALPRAVPLTLPCVKCGSGEKKKVKFTEEHSVIFDKHGGPTYSWDAVIDPETKKLIEAKVIASLTTQCIDCGYKTTTKTMDAKEAPHA